MSHTLPSLNNVFEIPLSKAYIGVKATNQNTGLGEMITYDDVKFCEVKVSFFSLKMI